MSLFFEVNYFDVAENMNMFTYTFYVSFLLRHLFRGIIFIFFCYFSAYVYLYVYN